MLLGLLDEFDSFTKVINSIVSKINIYNVFTERIDRDLKKGSYNFDLIEYLSKQDLEKNMKLLDTYPSRDFKYLRSNLNILGLDISFRKEEINKLGVMPFSFIENSKDKTIIENWLESYYPNILESYENAIKMYGLGHPVECLVNCRNVITGIFSYRKQEQTKWYFGLQRACNRDKNIISISAPSNIPSWKNGDVHNSDINKRYNYPRFKTIVQLYSYLSDLGAHKDEGNIINGNVDYEKPELCDALMGLRMTEYVLIWLYQGQQNEL